MSKPDFLIMAPEPTSNDGRCALSAPQRTDNTNTTKSSPPPRLPRASPERLASTSSPTVLYLAYGSNLSSSTFRGTRGIRPLSATNVHVPGLKLTFDLPGIPYTEPCFANTSLRTPPPPFQPPPPSPPRYHKDRWLKGLIGVVYEVTPEDYRTIIATEGGGASYQDITVPCFALPEGSSTVDWIPQGKPFLAHTLFSPPMGGRNRPDSSYAQPSARYLGLLTTGGEEHSLPAEYLAYLYQIRSYTITTRRQKIGQVLFLCLWAPLVLVFLGLGKLVADKEGRVPKWFAGLMDVIFGAMWRMYDAVFKRTFGDGERTMEEDDGSDGGDDVEDGNWERRKSGTWDCEKGGSLRK